MRKKVMLTALLCGLFICLAAIPITSERLVSASDGWIDPVVREPMQEGEYSLILVGDTQKAAESYQEYLSAMTQWVADHAAELNLKYLIAVGDIVDDVDTEVAGSDPDAQLTAASEAYAILDEAKIPYALALGNHDYEDMAFFRREITKFNQYFPLSRYEEMPSLAGVMGDTIENTYHYFEAGSEKFLILVLGHHPTDDIIAWGNSVIEAHADRRVIVVTHGYLQGDGCGTRTPRGEYLWQNMIKKHANIEMVCCGHELGEDSHRIVHSVEYGDNGNAVEQFMTNPADLPYGGAGLIVILRYRLDGRIEVDWYSPKLDQAYGSENQYEYYRPVLPEVSDGQILGGSAGEGLSSDFTSFSEGDSGWQRPLYALAGAELSEQGLEAEQAGSLTCLLETSEGEVFKGLRVSFEGLFAQGAGPTSAGLWVSVSEDGKTFSPTRFASPGAEVQSASDCMSESLSPPERRRRLC